MGWCDKLRTQRRNSVGRKADAYRAGYRDSGGNKCYVKDANGHTAVYFRVLEAKRAADRAEIHARAQAPNPVSPDGTITWDEWWARIGGNRHKFGNADKTEKINARDYISPTFGHERLNRIKRQMVKDWIQALIELGLSPAHIHKIYYLFKWTMNEAMETDPPVLQASPCGKNMGLPAVDKEKPQPEIEYEDLTLYRKLGLREDIANVVEYMMDVGMRPGESLGMHADQINWEEGWTWASNTMVPKPRTIKGFTKSGGKRRVPLTDEAIAIAAKSCEGRDLTRGCGVPHLDGKECTSALVFLSERGRPMTPDTLTTALTTFQKKHGLPHKTGYALRRGMITAQLGNGTPTAEVSKIVGHTGPNAGQQTVHYFQINQQTRRRMQDARNKATGAPATLAVVASNDHDSGGATRGATLTGRMSEKVVKQQDQRTG